MPTTRGRTRAQLSRLACRLLQWRKADGGLKEMSGRVAMLRLHREGRLQLPPPRNRKGGSSRIEHTFWSAPQPLLSRPVHELPGVHLEPVLSRPDSALWNEYIDRYHYLGYTPLPGAQLRCFARWENRLLALLGFGAPAWKTAPRDRFIGWCPSKRERNLQLIVNNARFLILPWVQSQNLASKLLALAARLLPQDWHDRYAYRPVLLETFVDTQRFTGACYKAAQLDPCRTDPRARQTGPGPQGRSAHQKHLALPPEQILPKSASLNLSPQAHLPFVIARLWVYRIFTRPA